MVLRRSDARRRRLVVDPSPVASQANENGDSTSGADKKSTGKNPDVRAYSYGANRRNVNKTTDLFPKRIVSYLFVVFALLACLGLINYGATQADHWRAQIGNDGASSLAIFGQGSVASWFTSFLLILSSLASLQIFALRKHRCDDYRGTYRLWVWMSGVFLFASLCCIIHLANITAFAFESLTQISFLQKPWLAPTFTISLLTILVARGVYEVRLSRGSMAWMVSAWLGYTAAVVFQVPVMQESVLLEFGSAMVVGNCILFATAALLMAHLTYVRFIFLRAHGLIKLKAKKKKVAKPKTKSKKSKPTKAKKKTVPKPDADDASETELESTKKKKQKLTSTKPKKVKLTIAANDDADEKAEEKDEVGTAKVASGSKPKKSSQVTLKELAAASRAKTKAQPEDNDSEMVEDDYESEGVIKMSKAQRRKARKQDRNRKRAA